jgi:hypothetical protein
MPARLGPKDTLKDLWLARDPWPSARLGMTKQRVTRELNAHRLTPRPQNAKKKIGNLRQVVILSRAHKIIGATSMDFGARHRVAY